MAVFSFFITLFSLLILDAAWLGLMFKQFYSPHMGYLLRDSIQYAPVAVFYILYACALNIFVIGPALKSHTAYLHTLWLGMLFGMVAYGAYDLTNQATLKGWPYLLTIVDLAWGSCLTGLACIITVYILRRLFIKTSSI